MKYVLFNCFFWVSLIGFGQTTYKVELFVNIYFQTDSLSDLSTCNNASYLLEISSEDSLFSSIPLHAKTQIIGPINLIANQNYRLNIIKLSDSTFVKSDELSAQQITSNTRIIREIRIIPSHTSQQEPLPPLLFLDAESASLSPENKLVLDLLLTFMHEYCYTLIGIYFNPNFENSEKVNRQRYFLILDYANDMGIESDRFIFIEDAHDVEIHEARFRVYSAWIDAGKD